MKEIEKIGIGNKLPVNNIKMYYKDDYRIGREKKT